MDTAGKRLWVIAVLGCLGLLLSWPVIGEARPTTYTIKLIVDPSLFSSPTIPTLITPTAVNNVSSTVGHVAIGFDQDIGTIWNGYVGDPDIGMVYLLWQRVFRKP